MSEEEIKKIAKEEFMNNVMEQLDSTLIFIYIQKLENQLQQKENIIKEVREKLLCYGETFDLKIHQQMQKELLEILDKGEDKE